MMETLAVKRLKKIKIFNLRLSWKMNDSPFQWLHQERKSSSLGVVIPRGEITFQSYQ